jgi:hypothetical protein
MILLKLIETKKKLKEVIHQTQHFLHAQIKLICQESQAS